MKRINPLKNIGPGTLIAAAFIGPGTVTVCSMTGAAYGFTLLWAILLSIFATVVLQGMSVRLGLVYGKGLAEAVRHEVNIKWLRWLALALIIGAILVGNSAYEAGNISGGVLGITAILPEAPNGFLIGIIGLTAFVLLFIGNYKVIEKALMGMVLLMSIAFVVTAILTKPDIFAILQGLFIPKQPDGSLLMVISLIGTTVVPYNLFLHAALVKEKWEGPADLKKAQKDTVISIALGGLVSMAIVVCAAAIQSGEIKNGLDLAEGLEPLFGEYAKYGLGIGLFAAGITSAITAPMAAAYVAKGCFGWTGGLKSTPFRMIWMLVLGIGLSVALTGFKPLQIISFAQISNGLLLPIIALFLLWIVNRPRVMKQHVNSKFQNLIGGGIILITIVLCIKTMAKVFDLI